MDAAGLNPFIFPPQLRFAGTHDNVVLDVLHGSVDVGAVRTYVACTVLAVARCVVQQRNGVSLGCCCFAGVKYPDVSLRVLGLRAHVQ